jgi:pilus assembly protein Flp/PilA
MLKLKDLIRDEQGVTAIEYGIIAALVAVAIIASVTLVGGRLNATFTRVGNALPSQ